MSSPAPPTFAADPPSPARVLVERQLGLLTRLADIGMEIAEAAGRRAVAALDDGEDDAHGAALAYDRAARAVRMTIALQARLLNDLPDLDKAEARARSEHTSAQVNRVHRIVERAAEAELDAPMDWRLSRDLRERLRDRDDYGALLKLPIGEAVARICKDLGLAPDWGELLFEAEVPPPIPLGSGGLIGEEPIMGPRSGGGGDRRDTAGRTAHTPPSPASPVLPPLPSGSRGRAFSAPAPA